MNILLVDDDADNRACMGDFLRDLGHQVTACENGFEAIERFREMPSDVVLTDLTMPGMNGYELAASLRGLFPAVSVEIVVFTGGAVIATEEMKSTAAVETCLTKPLNLDQLVQVLFGIFQRIDAASGRNDAPNPERKLQ
ncbi:MAG: response regulator [Solirubrobacterales bacterium]